MEFQYSLILFFLATLDRVQSVVDCPTNCTCHWDDGKVECSNLRTFPVGFKNVSLVKELFLANNQLTSVDKSQIQRLENIEFLDISNNNITELQGETFANLLYIRNIILAGNSLTSIKTNTFENLPSLKRLELFKNRISVIQENSFVNLTSLTLIDLQNNELTELKSSYFLNVPLLSVLILEKNSIMSFPVNICQSVPSLQSLYLDHNKIKSIGEYALDGCLEFQKLKMTNTSLNTMHENAFTCRQQAESGTNCLGKFKTLFLNKNNLTRPPAAFGERSFVRQLDLSENPLKIISKNDFTGLVYLTTLVISHIPTSFVIGESAFSKLSSVTKIILTNNPLLRNISVTAFKGLKNLNHVYLENNSLETLPFDLLNWQTLVEFDASNNKLQCNCDLKWIQDRYLQLNMEVKSVFKALKCNDSQNLKEILVINLNPSYFGCLGYDITNRVKTGLIVAAIVCLVSIMCLFFIKYRRKIFLKFRMYSYRRHRDDALFTVDSYSDYSDYSDSQESSQIIISKSSFSDEAAL